MPKSLDVYAYLGHMIHRGKCEEEGVEPKNWLDLSNEAQLFFMEEANRLYQEWLLKEEMRQFDFGTQVK